MSAPMDPSISVVDTKLDVVLQKIVGEAKSMTGFPISLVSIVMHQIQYFKAHIGLPPDLAISRATDRCSSLCQFVVDKGQPLSIEDTGLHPDLPQELIQRYGIVSYFGFPVVVNGITVGSLCVIDVKKNSLHQTVRSRMLELALKAGQHLQSLKKGTTSELILLEKASTPAISEIRNILGALTLASGQAAHLTQQINPIFFLLQEHLENRITNEEFLRGLSSLKETVRSHQKVPTLLQLIQNSVTRMTGTMYGLEGALSLKPGALSCEIADILVAGESLSHHLTKLVGGVSWMSVAERYQLNIPKNFAITFLGSVLTSISETALRNNLEPSGIQAKVEKNQTHAIIKLYFEGMPHFEWATLQSILSILACGCEAVTLKADDKGLAIHLPLI